MVRVPVPGLVEGRQTLGRDASHHLCRVLRLAAGDRFVAFDPTQKTEAPATILDPSWVSAQVEVEPLRPAAIIASSPLVLIYALAKGEKVDAVVRDATELGATRILVVRTARSVAKAEGDRANAKLDRWRRIAEQAARQCGRADPPRIDGVLPWKDALEAAAQDAEARFCLWESATEPLGAALPELLLRRASIAIAVGPEGGLTQDEVAGARVLGFAPVSLGPFILRTETVAAAVLGAIRILTIP